jgi:nucleotide-binding universal stress UspA family protein
MSNLLLIFPLKDGQQSQNMSKKILFPTGFADLSKKARANVIAMAEKMDAEIIAMHSIQSPNLIERWFSSYDREEDRDKVNKQLKQFAAGLAAETSAPVSSHLGMGAPDDAIVEAAKSLGVDMVIFGTQGGEGLRDTLLGSPVNHVIRNSPCPVLTIREVPHHTGFRRILVHLETLKETPELVGHAIEMAHLFEAELHFLALMTGDSEHNIQLDNRVRNAVKVARTRGVKVAELHLEPLSNDVEDEIEDYAKRIKADLICVLTQSDDEKGVKTLLRGSVADRVVNMSRFPILSVTPD